MVERRRFKRYDCALPCTVLERGAQRGFHSSEGLVSQISLLGCFVQSKRRPIAKTEIGLQIQSPQESTTTLRVFGTITNVASPEDSQRGFGVAFGTMTDSARQDLIRFIETLRSQDVLTTGSFRTIEEPRGAFSLDVTKNDLQSVESVEMPGMRKHKPK